MFFNWPQLYLLGGADDLLAEAGRHWEAVTAQLTGFAMLKDEYERGHDWFHQGDGGPSALSAVRKRPTTKNPGSRTWPATTRTTG